MFKVQTYNNIAEVGLSKFDPETYQVSHKETINNPDVILLRSQNLSSDMIPSSVLAVARAGSGVNNVPVDYLTNIGVPVFNTPGANANAVKELVLAGIFLSARKICSAWDYVNKIKGSQDEISKSIEQAKKQFKGVELPSKKLAVVGLGAIGVKVSNAALALGMDVVGYDPAITVERAWELSSDVKKAKSIESAIVNADFVSVHVPLNEHTNNLINKNILNLLKPTTVLLNFARNKIVDEQQVKTYLHNNKLGCYVTDFPSVDMQNNNKVIALPHLGASTLEAEENCSVWAANSLKDYLEHGIIQNSVNFPEVVFTKEYKYRLSVSNQNIPNMVAQITSILANHKLNILDLINKSRNNIAYSLIDLDNEPSIEAIEAIKKITGVLAVRNIKK